MVVAGMQIVGRAFIKAVQTEMRSSQQAAQARSSSGKTNMRSAATDALSGMTLQVLSLSLYRHCPSELASCILDSHEG